MQRRKIDELISNVNRKVADMDIDMKYKMELLGMITAIGIACEKELSIEPERKTGKWIKKECDLLYCSECDLPSLHPWPYCERCGAKMGEKSD